MSRSHGFGLRRLSRIEPSFPICVEPDTPAKGREIKIYCAAGTGRVGTSHPLVLVDVDVDSRTPSPSIERTSLFPPFSYIGSAAVIAQSIVCATRDAIIGVDFSERRTLKMVFCPYKNFRVVRQSFT